MKVSFSYVRNFIIIALACTLLAGCFEEKSIATGKTQTVEWFKEHNDERATVLKDCSNNPGEMENLPNCQNATAAELDMSTGELKPLNFDFKEADLPERPWRKKN
jgi:hypothetical protein